jgi:hypothetical protein
MPKRSKLTKSKQPKRPDKLTWAQALKKWNSTQPKWSIPKKGSKGYTEVKSLQK